MPFKKTHQQGSQPSGPLFIGRDKELLFFVQQILKPEEPTYNILSIWGQGGVGKTTLLRQFKNQAAMADFKASCLTAWVDERQATPAGIMEKFALQLHLGRAFEKALHRYKEALQFLPLSRPPGSLQQTVVTKAPDLAGSLLEGIPIVGPPLREITKAATEHFLDHSQTQQERSVASFNSPLDSLTQVFLTELNHIAEGKGAWLSGQPNRGRRVLLFFDTFEQVADQVVPWLLYSVLELEIHPNIVFIIAGRDPLKHSTTSGPKQWLPYYESHVLYALPLHPFTREETSVHLVQRGITTNEHIDTIWHLSHGLPLYLGLLTTNTQGTIDPTRDVVDNFLHRLLASEQTKRRLALDAALFSRPFNLDDLEAFPYLSEQERPTLYAWLLRQSFIRASSFDGRYLYHDIAQKLFQRYVFQHSPKAYYATRRTLATYYQRLLEHLQTVQERKQYGPSDERLEVMLALAEQRFFLPDEESHLQALFPLHEIWEYEVDEHRQIMLRLLRKIVQTLSHSQTGAHAHQVAQVYLRYMETWPTQYDQAHKQEWLVAKDELLKLMQHTSSPELLATTYEANGWGYLRFGEYRRALLWLERALELHPHSSRIKNGLGAAHYFLREYQRALSHFNDGLELAPPHPHLYLWRGRTYGKLKAYVQALADFDHAIQIDSNQEEELGYFYNDRGRMYLGLKEYHKALADWDHALEVIPLELPLAGRIQFQRGCAYLWLKDLLQAVTCFTRCSELGSMRVFSSSTAQDVICWVRAWSTLCQTTPDLGILPHLEAIAAESHYTGYVCRGVIFFLQKEFQPALRALQHATTLHYEIDWYPDLWADFWREWDAHFWLAMVYVALDQEEEARKAIEQALAFEMPPMLLKPLTWFEREKPKLYAQFIKPLLRTYDI